jgi:hypothetical protein
MRVLKVNVDRYGLRPGSCGPMRNGSRLILNLNLGETDAITLQHQICATHFDSIFLWVRVPSGTRQGVDPDNRMAHDLQLVCTYLDDITG